MFWKDFAEQLEFSLFLNLATAFMCRVFRTPLAEAGRWWNQELQMFLMKSVGSKHLRNFKNLVSMITGIISGWKKQCNAWYGFRVQCKLIISWGFLEISLAFQNTLLFQGLLSVSIKYSSFSLEELHSNLQNWLFNDTSIPNTICSIFTRNREFSNTSNCSWEQLLESRCWRELDAIVVSYMLNICSLWFMTIVPRSGLYTSLSQSHKCITWTWQLQYSQHFINILLYHRDILWLLNITIKVSSFSLWKYRQFSFVFQF